MSQGLSCPHCGCRDLRCPDGTPREYRQPWDVQKTERKPGYIRRRLRCRYCNAIVYTKETIETRIDD